MECSADALSLVAVRWFSISHAFGNMICDRTHLHYVPVSAVQGLKDGPSVVVGDGRENRIGGDGVSRLRGTVRHLVTPNGERAVFSGRCIRIK